MARRPDSLEALRRGGKAALARALSAVETDAADPGLDALLDAAWAQPRGRVLGLTGPPGVGKSTLTNALIRHYRDMGESVGVLAVDPSSQITGGALLGDRTRLVTDPEDAGVFVRSMAARDRLGGLSDHAVAAIMLMRAAMGRVIVESVGVGQSEGDVAHVSDVLALCIQPGSGDSLQFMKAGVMELPDLIVVTKADMGGLATRARADVAGAVSLARPPDARALPEVIAVSATSGEGIGDMTAACDALFERLERDGGLAAARARQARHHVVDTIRVRFGRVGAGLVDADAALAREGGPFSAVAALDRDLRARLGLQADKMMEGRGAGSPVARRRSAAGTSDGGTGRQR
jgi:LAO/AO transport system kinase